MSRGQALVEMALVTPVLLAMLLGMGEGAFLFASRHAYQNAADTIAAYAAAHFDGSWASVAASETARVGCDGSPVLSWPDRAPGPATRAVVRLTCHYRPRITANLWQGLPVSVEASATTPPAAPVAAVLPAMAPGTCGTVPSLVGLTASVAARVLALSGFPSGGLSGTWIVRSQSHPAGASAACFTMIGVSG